MSETTQDSNAIKRATFGDRICFHIGNSLPNYLEGIFLRNQFWTRVFDWLQPNSVAARFVRRMDEVYQTELLNVGSKRSPRLVIQCPKLIDHVLDRSPFIYVEPPAKLRGMNHFQPQALTISRNTDWQSKRRTHESSLASRATLELLKKWRPTIESECEQTLRDTGQRLTWQDLSLLFGRLSRRLILGNSARDDLQITAQLRRLMSQANRLIFLKKGKRFLEFQRSIEKYVNLAESDCLLSMPSSLNAGDRINGQIPHWMFAMNDTLCENTARALWIVGNMSDEERLRLTDKDFCRHCLLETMRLFPTTAMLGRAVAVTDCLDGAMLPVGTQIYVLSAAWHRNESNYPLAHRFQPERWAQSSTPQGYFLGGGQQRCAGEMLAIWLGSEVLLQLSTKARLISGSRIDLCVDLPWRVNVFHACWKIA